MTHIQTITPTVARRLAVAAQRLAGPQPPSDMDGMRDVVRNLNCLQLDPISAVAQSHLLVLWSRLGRYDPAHLDTLLWEERVLFEYWAHAASIVLTEDYQIHQRLMRRFPSRERSRTWLAANAEFRQYVLDRLAEAGPLSSKEIEDRAAVPWPSSGWTNNRNAGIMLDFLWSQGEIMVAGRKGRTRLWDLSARCLPAWAPRESLPEREVVRRAAQKALLALGVGRLRDINDHFTRGRYPDLGSVLTELESAGTIHPLQIVENGHPWPDRWYIHADTISQLERLLAGEWQPRTTLLSPFDNLICDRRRTEDLFDFHFRLEIYTPKARRKYGYYVLPILHGERLIGRLDPKLDHKMGRLTINAVYAEPDAPQDEAVAQAIGGAIVSLGNFVGAKTINFTGPAPEGWRAGLLT